MANMTIEERVAILETEAREFREKIATLFEKLERIANRLPNWAALLIVTLSSVCTGLIVSWFQKGG